MKNNPHSKEIKVGVKKKYVTFLSHQPLKADVLELFKLNFTPDTFQIIDDVIYLYYEHGAGRSKMSSIVFDKKLKVTSTSRNWNTVSKLFDLALTLKT
ncbi:MAG: hypothetical protein COB73_07070 [Flavobacteriaceae bacterium]|nr:MAG: hypothetical protein COB73_07070 [Flavobacteriaceae bacterium]